MIDQLAAAWCTVLHTGRVEPGDDFVESGGTSIAAVHLAAAIQEDLGVAIDAIEILEQGTFGAIGDLVASRKNAGTG